MSRSIPNKRSTYLGSTTSTPDRTPVYGCWTKNHGFLPPQIIHLLIGFSSIFFFHHPFWGTSIFGNTHICLTLESLGRCDMLNISSIPIHIIWPDSGKNSLLLQQNAALIPMFMENHHHPPATHYHRWYIKAFPMALPPPTSYLWDVWGVPSMPQRTHQGCGCVSKNQNDL